MKKIVLGVLLFLAGVIGGVIGVIKFAETEIKKEKNMLNDEKRFSQKHLKLFLMMNQWVRVRQAGKELASYLEDKGYKKIAIYGMSYAGDTLVEELQGTNIQVAYGIDKNADSLGANIDIVTMEDSLEDVDAIIVTAITCFDVIADELRKKICCPIISLEDVLYEI